MGGRINIDHARRSGGIKEKVWTDCVVDYLRLFGIEDGEGGKAAALDPGKWWERVMEGDRTLMATWKKEEKRAVEVHHNERYAEEADKVPIGLGVVAGLLTCFQNARYETLMPTIYTEKSY